MSVHKLSLTRTLLTTNKNLLLCLKVASHTRTHQACLFHPRTSAHSHSFSTLSTVCVTLQALYQATSLTTLRNYRNLTSHHQTSWSSWPKTGTGGSHTTSELSYHPSLCGVTFNADCRYGIPAADWKSLQSCSSFCARGGEKSSRAARRKPRIKAMKARVTQGLLLLSW